MQVAGCWIADWDYDAAGIAAAKTAQQEVIGIPPPLWMTKGYRMEKREEWLDVNFQTRGLTMDSSPHPESCKFARMQEQDFITRDSRWREHVQKQKAPCQRVDFIARAC